MQVFLWGYQCGIRWAREETLRYKDPVLMSEALGLGSDTPLDVRVGDRYMVVIKEP